MGTLIKDCSLRRKKRRNHPILFTVEYYCIAYELKLQIVHHPNVSCM